MQNANLITRARTFFVAASVFAAAASLAVPVGPQLPTDTAPSVGENKPKALPPLTVPPLNLAVVVFDPGLDETDDQMRKKGVWPEVRKAESIRTAVRVKQTIQRLNQFEQVTVAPSTTVSADLYLMGAIEESTTEDMRVRWRLLDARGVTWIPWNTVDYRVALGWHQRYYKPGKDAFQPIYDEIAQKVYAKLKIYAKDHGRVSKRNESRIRRGDATKLSKLDEVTNTRDLVMARFFAPSVFADTIKENKRRELQINYLPDLESEDWYKTRAFALRDEATALQYDTRYNMFFDQINPSYEAWLNELYPFARESRRERRRANTEKLIGGIFLLASIAMAGADTVGAADAAIGAGLVGGGLLVKSLIDRSDYKRNLNLFNEMSANYHDNFEPINVEIEKQIVTLEGTAHQQFTLWRQMLKEEYVHASQDTYAIEVVDE